MLFLVKLRSFSCKFSTAYCNSCFFLILSQHKPVFAQTVPPTPWILCHPYPHQRICNPSGVTSPPKSPTENEPLIHWNITSPPKKWFLEKSKGCKLPLKVTSATKLFFVINRPWCVINEFFYLKKKCFILEILRFLCFCETHWFQNLWRHHKALMDNGSYTYAYFFWILSTIKMKFGQMIRCCMTNISNMFLDECWRLEISSRLFYYFIKMTI